MYSVLIADDEVIIRNGLKRVVNWERLGFMIIGEAENGEEALALILKHNPDIVLLDIRMPLMNGLDVIQNVRANNYTGRIIILSGYSDFKYAQEAIRYGVKYYFTKPIDDDEFVKTLEMLSEQLREESRNSLTINHYKEKARKTILADLLNGNVDITKIDFKDIHITDNCYQVIIYEKYSEQFAVVSYNFPELFRIPNHNNKYLESITIDNNEIIILKGQFAINRFNEFLIRFKHELNVKSGSPLNSLFISYGRIVYSPMDLCFSYKEAYQLLQRRFFCEMHQHTIGYQLLTFTDYETYHLTNDLLLKCCSELVDYIQSSNRNMIAELLQDLKNKLYYSDANIADIKIFLTDLLLQIKEKINNTYYNKIPFPTNSQIINVIETSYYLYEILLFFTNQFEIILSSIGNTSRDNIIESIIYYIDHNYTEDLKLEMISPLFGYNSSYLGRIFKAKLGENFNTYLDRIRIKNSLKLLEQDTLKIYEISLKVGYKRVDYFEMKFKKLMGTTPTEYRKQFQFPMGASPHTPSLRAK